MSTTKQTHHDYMNQPQPNTLYLSPITSKEIEHEISELKAGKSAGPFSIPIKIIQLLNCFLSKPLEILYNCSFNTGLVPDCFKIVRVIPVYKKGSQIILSNYRPISLLSVFNKLLEKLMYKRVVTFLDKITCIHNKQFGFQSNHSTTHAILLAVDQIQRAMENGLFS